MDLAQTVSAISDAGVLGLLVIAVLGGAKGWYVWRWQYDRDMANKDATIARLLQENQKWENRVMRLLNVSEGLAEKVPST